MISPVEIRQQSFGKAIRGFDVEEVRAFLKSLSMEWDDLLTENRRLKMELESTKQNLQSFKELEAMLHKTLLQAENSSKVALENAEKIADEKITTASQQAANIINDAITEKEEVDKEITRLKEIKWHLIADLKNFLQQQFLHLSYYEDEVPSLITPNAPHLASSQTISAPKINPKSTEIPAPVTTEEPVYAEIPLSETVIAFNNIQEHIQVPIILNAQIEIPEVIHTPLQPSESVPVTKSLPRISPPPSEPTQLRTENPDNHDAATEATTREFVFPHKTEQTKNQNFFSKGVKSFFDTLKSKKDSNQEIVSDIVAEL